MKKLVALFFSLLATSAFAEEPCNGGSKTLEINACAAFELSESEKRLDSTFKEVLLYFSKSSDPSIKGNNALIKRDLIEAQRAWKIFIEKQCDLIDSINIAGTIHTFMGLACLREYTERRIFELEELKP